MFNEDKRGGPVSEKNWGVFFTNGTAVYDLHLGGSGLLGQNSSSAFCIARPGADEDSLRNGINWACGMGQANCAAIQQGQPCYNPNTLQNHASYAYNDYYQRSRSVGGTCDFDGLLQLILVTDHADLREALTRARVDCFRRLLLDQWDPHLVAQRMHSISAQQ